MKKCDLKLVVFIVFIVAILLSLVGCGQIDFEEEISNQEIFTLQYSAEEGGQISGQPTQTVEKNVDAELVEAVANVGFVFFEWSDGNKNCLRQDKNVTNNINVSAIFISQLIKVEYGAANGGWIEGSGNQNVAYGASSQLITAVPDVGYLFEIWSDGVTEPSRSDVINSPTSVTAFFRQRPIITIEYTAGTGGRIEGDMKQEIYEGATGRPVTIVPDPGFIFAKWSDGSVEKNRADYAQDDVLFTAEFTRIFSGTGTDESPYLVHNDIDLMNMVYYPSACYELAANIDLSDMSFEPIFGSEKCFDGVFDGKGYTIQNMTIDKPMLHPSLFGIISRDAVVKNVNMSDVLIVIPDFHTESAIYVGAVCSISEGALEHINISGAITGRKLSSKLIVIGGLVGISLNKISNCNSDIAIELENILPNQTTAGLTAGGLVGFIGGDIVSSEAKGTITFSADEVGNNNTKNFGGLIGAFIDFESTAVIHIANCKSDVAIAGNCAAFSGGLIGRIYEADVTFFINGCSTTGNLNIGEYGNGGGFIGSMIVTVDSEIIDCYATGDIQARRAGGFADSLTGAACEFTVMNCFSTGTVTAVSGSGFSNSVSCTVTGCYSTSDVTAKGEAVGFANTISGVIKYCFATGDVSGFTIATGFSNISYRSSIEECYTRCTVSSERAGAGFIFNATNSTILNCYANTDIIMLNTENASIMVGGLAIISNAESQIINCYYAGNMSIASYRETSSIGAIAAMNRGVVKNCHWFLASGSVTVQTFGSNTNANTDVYAYVAAAEMFVIAGLLNADQNDVWQNIDSSFPTLNNCQII